MERRRRSAAAVAAVAVLAEAVGLAGLLWILGLVVRAQEMTLDGVPPEVTAGAAWGGAALLGLLLLACAVALLRVAVRDRIGGRPSRALLVTALVVQAVLATLAVGLVGWWAFAGAMGLFGLLLLVLTSYPAPPRRAARNAADLDPDPAPHTAAPADPPAVNAPAGAAGADPVAPGARQGPPRRGAPASAPEASAPPATGAPVPHAVGARVGVGGAAGGLRTRRWPSTGR